MPLTYRTATTDDVPLLTRLNIQLRADEKIDNVMSDEEVGRRMAGMLSGTYIVLLFTNDESEVVGYTLTDHARTPMYLRQLFVKKEFRKKGYGRELIQLTMKHLKIGEIDLEVMVWNENARRFYKRIGCKERYLGLRYHLEDTSASQIHESPQT